MSQGRSVTVTSIYCVRCAMLLKQEFGSTWETGDPASEVFDRAWDEARHRHGPDHHVVTRRD